MIEMFFLLLIFCASGIQGAHEEYVYYDEANGWLKYYSIPATWEDAKIRCESNGAVLASPLTAPLRDAITRHILQKDPTASMVYTGVHADFESGDYFTVEGVQMRQLSVPLRASSPINYNSQHSCVVWDVVHTVLKKVKCDSKLPSICYKKRIEANLPVGPSLPVDPSAPVDPSLPVAPIAPVDSSLLVGPSAPVGPRTPVGSATPVETSTDVTPDPRPLNHTQSGLPTSKPSGGIRVFIGNVQVDNQSPPYDRDSTIPTLEQQQQSQGYSPVPQSNPASQSGYNRPSNTNPDVSKPNGQLGQTDQNVQQPTSGYKNPVEKLGYVFIRQAEGWLKLYQPATWDEANNRCTSEGAVIASPLTPELHNAISYYVAQKDRSISRLYSGVHANFNNGDFFSKEGVALTKMSVILDQDANIKYNSSESCITMNIFNVRVTSVRCTDLLPFVCYKKETVVHGCDKHYPGYTYEKRTGSCYKFHTRPMTWQRAYDKCRDEQAYLVVTNNDIENLAMMDLFAKYPASTLTSYYKNNIFVGRRDWLDGQSWRTVRGESLSDSGFLGWARTEPNNAGGNENCGTMDRNGLMYDDPCNISLSFICEKQSEVFDNDG